MPTSRNHFTAAAVELELVDRLAGADLAQLGRAVGGEHEQRNARLVRLGDRGREVRRGGARGDRRRRRATRSPWPARARRSRRSARRRATTRAAASRARAPARCGEEREPGEVQAWRIPQRASSSTKARRRRCVSMMGVGARPGAPPRFYADRRELELRSPRGRPNATACMRRTCAATAAPPPPAGELRRGGRRRRGGDARPLHARRLLDGRPDRAGGRAGAPGARRAARRSSAPRRGWPTRASARSAAGRRGAGRSSSSATGVEAFARRWGAQPLFAGQPTEVSRAAHEDRLRKDRGRARRGAAWPGHGRDGALWDRLGELADAGRADRRRARRALPRNRTSGWPSASSTPSYT